MKNKEDWIFHNTKLLLEHYRDVVWSLEVAAFRTNASFETEFGSSLEEFLELSYEAGLDLPESDVASRIQSMNKSRNMLRIIDSSVTILRERNKFGEIYYWVLYYTYLSPQQLGSVDEIIENLTAYIPDLAKATYYRRRNEAIQQLGRLLWGYTTKECEKLLTLFFDDKTEKKR